MKMAFNFKDKFFNELSLADKIDFIDRVCMDHLAYLSGHSKKAQGSGFLGYWEKHIQNKDVEISNSPILSRFKYSDKIGFHIVTLSGETICLKYNTAETYLFVYNCVNDFPLISPLVKLVEEGFSKEKIRKAGAYVEEYHKDLRPTGMKKNIGRPPLKDSLRQKIKRGEITRYEAYQKKKLEEDSL